MRGLSFAAVFFVVLTVACQYNEVPGAGKTVSFGKGSSAGEKKTLTVNGVDFTFCWCPPGEFMMGSPRSEDGHNDSEKQHRVRLTKGFWLLESEVTQEMWKSVMGTSIQDLFTQEERRTRHELDPPSVEFLGAKKPMWFVNWGECQDFCGKLGALTGQKIVLPTEAQWEYACRAGTAGPYAGTGDLDDMGWYGKNSGGRLHEVKGKKANAWGLYDMHGNVWEWCSDWYDNEYYWESPENDPTGPSEGSNRVLRGGAWGHLAGDCRSAIRDLVWRELYVRFDYLGFRPALIP